jgi:hypothetical protein
MPLLWRRKEIDRKKELLRERRRKQRIKKEEGTVRNEKRNERELTFQLKRERKPRLWLGRKE